MILLLGHSVQFSSVVQSCLTLCNPMNCSSPDFPVHHQLLEHHYCLLIHPKTATNITCIRWILCVCQSLSRVWIFVTPLTLACQLFCVWNSPSTNTGVDCHFLLQGIFLTQGLNPGLLHCGQIPYYLSYREIPYMNLIVSKRCTFNMYLGGNYKRSL